VVSLWADAVANRLEAWQSTCPAMSSRRSPTIRARQPAASADPRQLIDRAPGDNEFTIPDCSDPRAITCYALQCLNVIIAAYQAFLDMVRGRDDVSFALVVGLLGTETHRRADVTAALAGQ